jgi:hypothetical protein
VDAEGSGPRFASFIAIKMYYYSIFIIKISVRNAKAQTELTIWAFYYNLKL